MYNDRMIIIHSMKPSMRNFTECRQDRTILSIKFLPPLVEIIFK